MPHPGSSPVSTPRGQLSDAKRALIEKRLRGESVSTTTSAPGPPPLVRRHLTEAPLSFAQQRLWFLEQFAPGNPFYTESSAVPFAFALDVPVFDAAVKRYG